MSTTIGKFYLLSRVRSNSPAPVHGFHAEDMNISGYDSYEEAEQRFREGAYDGDRCDYIIVHVVAVAKSSGHYSMVRQ